MIGLLPPPEEVEAFVNDPSPDAWEKRIDQLLASPHYGERWGRHWLDVARYADSWGHIHDDDNPNAWRYRDYVIESFNDDKPYDRFIREQLAGDEFDESRMRRLIATGFHRIGPRVLFREKQNPHYRYDYLDDMIGTTIPRIPRTDCHLRPLPRSQVRSHLADGLLPDDGDLLSRSSITTIRWPRRKKRRRTRQVKRRSKRRFRRYARDQADRGALLEAAFEKTT